MSGLVSDQDLARARSDAEFRQLFLQDNLERLLQALKALRSAADPTPSSARQLREGVDLAVKLADRLQQTAQGRSSRVA